MQNKSIINLNLKQMKKSIKWLLLGLFALVMGVSVPITIDQVSDTQIVSSAHAAIGDDVMDYIDEYYPGSNVNICEPKPNTIEDYRVYLTTVPQMQNIYITVHISSGVIISHWEYW